MTRYLRLALALAKFSLLRELAFRGNFLAKITVEILWLGILLLFYRTVFARTTYVAGWAEAEYLFFVGCYFAMEGLVETFFLENCNGFADLVRSGDLDFFLLQPIDEQFLLTCRNFDWSTLPNVVLGGAVMGLSLTQMENWSFDPGRAALFVLLFLCGLGMAYSFLVLLTSTAVWFVRNQSLFEMWWLFTSLMRYPRDIFTGSLAGYLGWFFTFVIPILLVVNVPAQTMVKILQPEMMLFTAATTAALLALSRWFLRFSLRRYRSASS